ncbi:MAG TPA: serine protease [Planctomycetota bacterium]
MPLRFAPVLLIASMLGPLVLAADENVEQQAIRSTVRLRLDTVEGDYVVTGHGSAFGIDLSPYGLGARHFLLSAAHLVLDKKGPGLAQGDLKIELSSKQWTRCRVTAYDKKLDLCLLQCDSDLDYLCSLERRELSIGDPLLVVGSPAGVPICASRGQLVSKDPPVSGKLWEARAKFWHGNSGGPVFDAAKGTIVGVAVAGVQDQTGDMARDVALFTPTKEVRNFVQSEAAKLKLAEFAAEFRAPAVIER